MTHEVKCQIIIDLWVKIILKQKEENMITVAQIQEKIAEASTQSGLTQTEIARRLNVRPTQVCSYAKGRKMPALETLANFCKILDLDANEILCLK